MKPIVWMMLVAAPAFSQTAGLGELRPDQALSFVNEGDIDAPISEVWKVWTSGEGYRALGVAKAEVDLRPGGLIRSHYSESGVIGDENTIVNRILAYEPPRMIAIRIDRPPKKFPFKEAWKNTWTVITLTEIGPARTHLRVASLGFGTDEESAAMRNFFQRGNAVTIEALQKHFNPRRGAAPR